MKFIYTVTGLLCILHSSEGCNEDLKGTTAPVGGTAVFQYNDLTIPTTGTIIYEVARGTDIAKVRIKYVSGSQSGDTQMNTGITFTGNETTGSIAFDFAGVTSSDIGNYILKNALGDELQCIQLHISGAAPTVQLTGPNNKNEDDSVTFTCTATSHANPVAPLAYSWEKDGVTKNGETSSSLNISSAATTDSGEYKCIATEDITGGQSSTSNGISLTVIGTTTTTTTTTSTSTTTTTTPPPTTTTTIPSTTTATSTTTTTTTPTTITTITTTPMPTTRTTTTTTPSTTTRPTAQSPTTTPSTSTSSIPSTTTPSNTRGVSNTSLIAMIVVVSVIGGILVIAIVFMILVMVYGKSGLPLSTPRKGTHHRPAVDKHHRHHRHHNHHKRRERSEHSFYQFQNVLAGYSFYRGGVENPVFQDSMDYPNTPVLYHKDANEMFHAPRYDEQPPEYQYAVNWEGLD